MEAVTVLLYVTDKLGDLLKGQLRAWKDMVQANHNHGQDYLDANAHSVSMAASELQLTVCKKSCCFLFHIQ